jgi:hypothetical protein
MVQMLSQKKGFMLEANSNYEIKLAAYEPALGVPTGQYELKVAWTINDHTRIFQWPIPLTIRGPVWEWFRK